MSYREKFYSRYVTTQAARLYGAESLDDVEAKFPVWENYFGKFLPKDTNARILDLGCGNGAFVHWLQRSGFRNAEGMDVSREQVEKARELGITNVVQGDVLEFLKGKEDIYDAIFAQDLIEHLTKEEILTLCEQIRTSLKQGGSFIIQTLNAENLLWGRLGWGDFTHETAFTESGVSQLLLVAGFTKVNVYPQRPVVHGLKSFLRYALWRIFELMMHAYLIVETGSSRGIFTQNLIVAAHK